MTLDIEQRQDATAAEQAAMTEIELARKNGEDPFGDDELDNLPDPTADLDEAAETVEQADPTDTPDEPPEPVAQYQAEVAPGYKDQRSALMAEKALAMKQLMDGELEVDAFAAIEARVSDALEELTAQRIRAETLTEANQQNTHQQNQREVLRMVAKVKAEVDYMADPKAQKQFDMALSLTRSDPDNAGKDFGDLIQEAHKTVLALRGVQSKSSQLETAIKGRPTPAAPVTLRGLPVAATPNSNGDVLDQMARLSGQAYENAFAKLSPSQRARLVDED